MDGRVRHMGEGKRRALTLLVWLPIVALIVNSVVVSSLPYSAWGEATSLIGREHVMRVLPQGWAFFTRDPREPRLFLYRRTDDGQWASVDAGTNGAPRWAFGLRRNARMQGIESGSILLDINDSDWSQCSEPDPVLCLDRLMTSSRHSASNPLARPDLCGSIGFVRREPVPWAWRSHADTIVMPQEAVVVEVTCR